MSILPPGPCLVWYNGRLFPVETQTKIGERPVLDESKRTVREVVYTINVKSVIGQENQQDGQTADGVLALLRKQLMAVAGELHVEGLGYGPLVANIPPSGPTVGSASPHRDVRWGPIPKKLNWEPRGQYAGEVEWECEVALEPCDDAVYAGGILEYVYGITTSVDKSGYTKRTIKGSVSIPQTRLAVGATALLDHADRLREAVTPGLPLGFRRLSSDTTLSLDKCKLEFAFTDQDEGPNYLPPGVVEATMRHTVVSPQYGQGRWTGTLAATYEMVRGVDRALAWDYFRAVLLNKARWAVEYPYAPKGRPPSQAVIITNVSLSEPEVYGRKGGEFVARYTFSANLETVVNASGLWRPLPNGTALGWANSMSGVNKPWSSRGNAGLKFDPSAEAIIDLCHQYGSGANAAPPNPAPPTPGFDTGGDDYGTPPGSGGGPDPGFDSGGDPFGDVNDSPDPDTSWLWFESRVRTESLEGKIVLKPLPPAGQAPPPLGLVAPGLDLPPFLVPPPDLEGGGTGGGSMPDLEGGSYLGPPPPIQGGGTSGPIPDSGPDVSAAGLSDYPASAATPRVVVQTRAAPEIYATLTGCALRAGYPIAPPRLVSIGGAAVTPMNRPGGGFEQELAGNLFGLPLYRAEWTLRYLVLGTPAGNLPLMDTPFA